jgi:hypothetical protein
MTGIRGLFRSVGERSGRVWKAAENLINNLEGLDDTERQIVRTRWLSVAKRYEELWRNERIAYYSFRVPIIIGAATVPVLASLSVPRIATALVGLAVAILTGLDSLFQFGNRWRQGRLAATLITFEGWRFLELSGEAYEKLGRQDAYKLFLTQLEKLNERLSTTRLDLFSDKGRGSHSHE